MSTSNTSSALTSAEQIATEAQDLADFLATAGTDLDPETARTVEYILAGLHQVLVGLVARVEQAGPS